MTQNILKTSALTAFAVAALVAPSAHAALSYNSGDIFLGFHQAGNTTTDYVIDLGSGSTFRDSTSQVTLSLSGLSADLTSAFGSLSNISWGIVGTTQNTAANGDPIRLLYSSEPTGSSAPTASSSQSGPATQIIGFKNYWISLTGSQGTVSNSAFEDAGNTQSWTTKIGTTFGTGAIAPIEAPLTSSLDLFRIPQTTTGQPVTNEGTFSFNPGNSTVTFTSSSLAAVPEPSTFLFGCAIVGALGIKRRRAVSA